MNNNETILIVEDEPALRQLMAGTLSGAGYEVHQARNGAEATAVFARHGAAIDLVITDVQMPYIDGAALVETLRAQRKSLKILCISGTAQAAPAGADAFIKKPFSRDEFLAQIRELLVR
jgi:DNA-binding response OmpR family regulator